MIAFLRDKLSVPGKKGIRGNERFDFIRQMPANDLGRYGTRVKLRLSRKGSVTLALRGSPPQSESYQPVR